MTLPLPHPWVPDPQTQKNFEAISLALHPPVPQARVYNSANLSIPDNANTALTFDSERFDEGDLHSTSANTSRLTASVAGLWLAGAHVEFDTNSTGVRELQLRLNGATYVGISKTDAASATGTRLSVTALYRLAVTDYLEAVAYQNSGGNLNVTTNGAYSPEFWMVRLAGYAGEHFTG